METTQGTNDHSRPMLSANQIDPLGETWLALEGLLRQQCDKEQFVYEEGKPQMLYVKSGAPKI
jgi:hypothetical protein